MKNSAFDDFNEAAQEALNFAKGKSCGGSHISAAYTCRVGGGGPSAGDKEAPKGKSSGGGGSASKGKSPKAEMATLKSKNKKLSDEYERLRGDKSPQAEKRRKEIMTASRKNTDAQKSLSARMEAGAKSQSPAKAPDRSPAGQQRRSAAATRARD
jgi:hypothetical protein